MSRLFGFPPQVASYSDAQAWAAAAPLVHPGYVAGRWYWRGPTVSVSSGALGTGSLSLSAFLLTRSITISDLATRIVTAFASGNIALAIYASDPVTKLPIGLPLASTGSISTTATGMVSADITGADVVLPAGLYWMGGIADNATVAILTGAAGDDLNGVLIGSTSMANLASSGTVARVAYVIASSFGTWPNLTTTPATETPNAALHMVAFKVSVGG